MTSSKWVSKADINVVCSFVLSLFLFCLYKFWNTVSFTIEPAAWKHSRKRDRKPVKCALVCLHEAAAAVKLYDPINLLNCRCIRMPRIGSWNPRSLQKKKKDSESNHFLIIWSEIVLIRGEEGYLQTFTHTSQSFAINHESKPYLYQLLNIENQINC